MSLPSGDVTWRITRRPFLLWKYFRPSAPTQVAEGSATLSGDGTFHVSFRPQKEEDPNPYASAYQTYEVSATVTDSKGETQEANYTFSVGESSIVLFHEPTATNRERLGKSRSRSPDNQWGDGFHLRYFQDRRTDREPIR